MDAKFISYIKQSRNQFVHHFYNGLSTEKRVQAENFLIAFDQLLDEYIENKPLKDFVTEFQSMRKAQSLYFATRNEGNLSLAKKLERKADKKAIEILKMKPRLEYVQQKIFEFNDQRV